LRAGAREAQAFDRWDASPDLLGELDLDLGRGGERGAATDLLLDRRHDRRVGVAEDQRGVVAEEVAVGVAVHVGDAQPRPGRDVGWVRRRVDRRPGGSAGQRSGRALEQLARARRSGQIVVEQGQRTPPWWLPTVYEPGAMQIRSTAVPCGR